jgi:xanthine dehydrogenase YagR molybdenum-binding subunit
LPLFNHNGHTRSSVVPFSALRLGHAHARAAVDAHGRYLIGQDVAAAIYTHWRWPGKAQVTLNGDGSALVEAAAHDIGNGTYTIMAQVAADAFGLPPDRVVVRLGDTRLPESHPAIRSAPTANATAAVMLAAQAARAKAIELALTGRDAPFAAGGRRGRDRR